MPQLPDDRFLFLMQNPGDATPADFAAMTDQQLDTFGATAFGGGEIQGPQETPGGALEGALEEVGGFASGFDRFFFRPLVEGAKQTPSFLGEVASDPRQALSDIARGSDLFGGEFEDPRPRPEGPPVPPGRQGIRRLQQQAGEFMEQPTSIDEIVAIGQEEGLAEAAGAATGIVAQFLLPEMLGRVPTRRASGTRTFNLPGDETVDIPALRSERPGARFQGAARRAENISRRTAGGRETFREFEAGRVDQMIDDFAGAIIRDVSQAPETAQRAGTALQTTLNRTLEALKERAAPQLDAAENAAISAGVQVELKALPKLARDVLQKQEAAREAMTVSGTGSLINELRSATEAGQVGARGAFELLKVLRDKARGTEAQGLLPGISGGAARGLASRLEADISSSLRSFDPDLAQAWRKANNRFARAARQVKNKAVERLVQTGRSEDIPGALMQVEIRELPRIKTLVGKERFDRAARQGIESKVLREAVRGEELGAESVVQRVSRSLDELKGQGLGAGRERELMVARATNALEDLAENGRLRALTSRNTERAFDQFIQEMELQGASRGGSGDSIVAAIIDNATLQAATLGVAGGVTGAVVGGGGGALAGAATGLAAPLSAQAMTRLYARLATRPQGLTTLRKALQQARGPGLTAAAVARVADQIRQDPEAMMIAMRETGAPQPVQIPASAR